MTAVGSLPDPDPAELPRPTRPAAVELGAAILIVGGATNLLAALTSLPRLPAGAEMFLAGAIGIAVGSIVLGLLVRIGRAWLLAVNYAAILGFLDLLGAGGSPFSLMLGLAEILVVGILLRKPCSMRCDPGRADVASPAADARSPLSPPTASRPTSSLDTKNTS